MLVEIGPFRLCEEEGPLTTGQDLNIYTVPLFMWNGLYYTRGGQTEFLHVYLRFFILYAINNSSGVIVLPSVYFST